jgi:hypothetical protein
MYKIIGPADLYETKNIVRDIHCDCFGGYNSLRFNNSKF